MKKWFENLNLKTRRSIMFLGVVALVCCIGVVNNRIQTSKSLSVSAGYDEYEQAEMEEHNGDVLVDSLKLTEMPGSSEDAEAGDGGESEESAEVETSAIVDEDTEGSGENSAGGSGESGAEKSEGSGENGENAGSEDGGESDAKDVGSMLVTSDDATEIENTDEYFREARETLTYDRNEMISMLTDTIETAAEGSEKSSAESQKAKLLEYMNMEKSIESLIRNKGFTDAFVIITDRSVNITVQADDLAASDVAKILDIAMRETGRSVDEIVVQTKSAQGNSTQGTDEQGNTGQGDTAQGNAA